MELRGDDTLCQQCLAHNNNGSHGCPGSILGIGIVQFRLHLGTGRKSDYSNCHDCGRCVIVLYTALGLPVKRTDLYALSMALLAAIGFITIGLGHRAWI